MKSAIHLRAGCHHQRRESKPSPIVDHLPCGRGLGVPLHCTRSDDRGLAVDAPILVCSNVMVLSGDFLHDPQFASFALSNRARLISRGATNQPSAKEARMSTSTAPHDLAAIKHAFGARTHPGSLSFSGCGSWRYETSGTSSHGCPQGILYLHKH
jgi:hypothetical protein